MRPPSRALGAMPTILTLLFLARTALASPAQGLDRPLNARDASTTSAATNPALLSWVTVDSTGAAVTIVPTVTTDNSGVVSTLSTAPASLTTSQVYTLSLDGSTTVRTGIAPTATPTGTGDDVSGAFLLLGHIQGPLAPFGQPFEGAILEEGKTYYITWDPAYFTHSNVTIQVQGKYLNSSSPGLGFASEQLTAGVGFWPWHISSTTLDDYNVASDKDLDVILYLTFDATQLNGNETEVFLSGPEVVITRAVSGSGGPSKAAIIIPILLVLAIIGLMAFCFLSWRRNGRLPLVANMRRRFSSSGQGYGIRQGRSQRTAAGRGIALGNSPTAPAGPAPGRNVFREELQRQENEA